MNKARIAFIGCGAITRNNHLPAGLRSPCVDVHALVDANRETAESLARMYGLGETVTIATDVSEVMDQADGFVLATPNDTHASIATKILERGKPVLIEKPITTTYEDAVALCDLADTRGTFISVGYRYRFFPSVRLLKRLLDENYFGAVRGFHCEMGSRGGWAPVSGYNLDRTRSGGGVLVVNGTHFLDLVLCWFGEPASIVYEDDNYGNVEANCKGTMHFAGDAEPFDGTFFFSKTIKLKNHFVIDTEQCRVEWSSLDSNHVTAFEKRRPDVHINLSAQDAPGGAVDYFQVQLEEFCRNIEQRGVVTNDARTAALSLKLIEQMYAESSRLSEAWLTYKT